MKVKLLKKVRKRYEITKVIKISNSGDTLFYNKSKEKFGLPFFVFRDNTDSFDLRTESFKTLEEATANVLYRTRIDYTKIVRPQRTIEEKVWYLKQHK